jgi:hypothetical protein
MTKNPRRTAVRIATVAAAAVIGGFSLGCGIVQNAVDTANTLSEFSDRLGKAAELTYTAEYQTQDATVTLVQSPPNSAVINGDQRLIMTADVMLICDAGECQQAPSAAAASGVADANLIAGVAGAGFLTPELALGLVAAAAMVPGTDVSTSDREIAGQDSLCADVTGIEDPQGGQGEMLQAFSVCVTEHGVLSAFSGESNTGEHASIELVGYSDEVDAAAFAPPAGATVVDVTTLGQ